MSITDQQVQGEFIKFYSPNPVSSSLQLTFFQFSMRLTNDAFVNYTVEWGKVKWPSS